MASSIKFTDNSAKILAAFQSAEEKGLETIGLVAEGYAKKLCPVGTPESTGIPGYQGGTARNSISHAVEKRAVYIGSNVFYFIFFELGTRYMKARPTLRPAAADHPQTYKRIMMQALKNG